MDTTHSLFVGTYTNGASEGIYKFTFDTSTGELTNRELAAKLNNPSYLKISSDKKNLYAVQETADFDSLGGGVTAFQLEGGKLKLLNSAGTAGTHPCHVSLSGDGKLVASNYGGGNVSIHRLNPDGALGENPQVIDHKVLDTSKTSHAHMAQFVGDKLFVADLGLDAVKQYQEKNGKYTPAAQPSLDVIQGAGPRHFTVSASGKLYVINELNSTLSVFEKNASGEYEEIQTISTLDPDFEGKSYCADIHLSSDGKFLYGSNRGENNIVTFSVDETSGKVTPVGWESVRGDWPRNFSLDPSGKFLLVANQRSHNITIFSRDQNAGTLEFLSEVQMDSPVCLEFLD
ncbi:lactonase family protein [Flagellimonas myxillae]|uniref:lactonase family protein n=1 Tax=Flagellimonas myxillae TaxID=2942214 RepID=UPI00201F29B7|nr:lactonase family protein [Muricauda myxillae]MCL6266806.1 lactonase family protein [Muricauda myxillae]